jgi:hypothetical protein
LADDRNDRPLMYTSFDEPEAASSVCAAWAPFDDLLDHLQAE